MADKYIITLYMAANLLSSAHYHVVATVRDPRTNEGMKDAPTMGCCTESRDIAVHQAKQWASDGYWSSVYDKASSEAIYDFSPKGGVHGLRA